jgi:hypothetical protein
MSPETFQWVVLILLALILMSVWFGAYRGSRR